MAKSARLVPREGTVTSVEAGVIQSALRSIATMSKDVFGRLKIQLYQFTPGMRNKRKEGGNIKDF